MQPFVPHFILQQYGNNCFHGHFHAATVFIDISGFTGLTETLIQHHREGAEVLTESLNAIFNPLVAQVYACEGMIPLFAGDAFTAVFPYDNDTAARQVSLRNALHTAFLIRTLFADYKIHTPYGDFDIGIKIGLSVGQVEWGIPQKDGAAAFYFRGEAIDKCAWCQQQAQTGEIIVDQTMMSLIQNEVTAELIYESEPSSTTDLPPARYYRLWGCSFTQPTIAREPVPVSRSALQPFLPDVILDLPTKGEFREICPVFISFVEPEAYTQLHAFICEVMALARQYGGLLSQLDFGDKGALMVLWFGAPMTYENNLERATKCLLALRKNNQQLAHPIQWRAGMTFGMVWAGIRGGEARCEYGTAGDVVNLAARIATRANWGDIWMSQPVYEQIKNGYQFAYTRQCQFKGKSQMTTIYALAGLNQQSEVSFFTEQMIGRQAELGQLQAFIRPIFDGRFAGLITIYGEAGMGKSRLLFELNKYLSYHHRLNWFFCPAEEILRQSLNPFRYFLYRYFEQSSEQTAAENRGRFDTVLETLLRRLQGVSSTQEQAALIRGELQRTRSMLGALVGVYWPDSLYERLAPKLRFKNTLTAVKYLILAESLFQPVIIQLEDAHWLDEDSYELIHFLTAGVAAYPLAILCAGRYADDGSKFTFALPEAVPQDVVELDNLSFHDIQTIAAELVDGALTEKTVQFLMQKCNGNPFFVEQLSLDLKERGLLTLNEDGFYALQDQRIHEVPSTISAVLMARLDRLTTEVKHVVQTAAVLGREFELLILTHMLQHDRQLGSKVKIAEEAQIWAALNEIRYIFKHTLLRDSAYNMQLRARLRQLHYLAAVAIQKAYKSDLIPYYADLAYHYDQAEKSAQAAHWYYLAGQQAAAQFANEQAVAYFTRALALTPTADHDTRYTLFLAREQVYGVQGNREAQQQDLNNLGLEAHYLDDVQRQVEVALQLTKFAYVTGDYPAAIAAARMAVDIAHRARHKPGKAAGYLLWGRTLWRRGDYVAALPYLKKALKLAQSTHLRQLEADCLCNLGAVFSYQGDFGKAEVHSEQSLQIYRQIRDRHGENAALNNLAEIWLAQGKFAQSGTYYAQALKMAQETGEKESEGLIWHNLGRSARLQGAYIDAQDNLEQSLQISREIGDRRSQGETLAELGNLFLSLGDYDTAKAYYEQALYICNDIGDQHVEGYVLAHMGLLFHYLDDQAIGWEYSQQALRLIRQMGDSLMEATALTCLGHAFVGMKQLQRANICYGEALTLRRQLAQHHRAVEALAGLAHICWLEDDLDQALTYVKEIYHYLEGHDLEGIQEPFRVCLICYRVLLPNHESEAQFVLQKAYHLLQQRARQIKSEKLQTYFLHQVSAHQEILSEFAQYQERRLPT